MPQGQGGDDALGGDESRASTEGATDKPANDGALHESDPANDDLAAQFPLTDGGILDSLVGVPDSMESSAWLP